MRITLYFADGTTIDVSASDMALTENSLKIKKYSGETLIVPLFNLKYYVTEGR